MTHSLANFSIENENSILLFFLDGSVRRAQPSELPNILAESDLKKVNKALNLRKTFIKKVLPPGAMILLLSASLALGIYDIGRLAQLMQPNPPISSSQVTEKIEPSSPLSTQAQVKEEAVIKEKALPESVPMIQGVEKNESFNLRRDSRSEKEKYQVPATRNSEDFVERKINILKDTNLFK